MQILIALAAAAATVQEAESQYREALYLEVDKGDLDKALDLYGKVQADASAPEAVRARAAFRAAWCLEKKGRKAEAERAYRDVSARYPGQAETAQKARERLDRPVTGDGPTSAPASMDQRIADLVIELVSQEKGGQALQALVLIGDAAVPALRKALLHKDRTLSAMAAYALIRTGQDEGTYEPLKYWVEEGSLTHPRDLAALLSRRPDYLKDFIASYNKEEDRTVLHQYHKVIRHLDPAPFRARLETLLLQGDADLAEGIGGALKVSREEELLGYLSKLEGSKDLARRAEKFLSSVQLRVKDVPAFTKRILAVFPTLEGDDPVVVLVPGFLHVLDSFVPRADILRRCGGTWLRSGGSHAVMVIDTLLMNLRPHHLGVIIQMLKEDLPDEARYRLIARWIGSAKSVEPALRTDLEETFWPLLGRGNEHVRAAAAEALSGLVKEDHPRWGELIAWAVQQPQRSVNVSFEGREIATRNPFLEKVYQGVGGEGKKRIWRELVRNMNEGKDEGRLIAVEWACALEPKSTKVFEALSAVALDRKQAAEVRKAAIISLVDWAELPKTPPDAFFELTKDPDKAVRRAAVRMLTHWGTPRTDAFLAGLVEDADAEISDIASRYFIRRPRAEFLAPLLHAIKSPHEQLRADAIQALGKTESLEAVPHLLPLLDDAQDGVRNLARDALKQIRARYEEIDQWRKWYEGVKPK